MNVTYRDSTSSPFSMTEDSSASGSPDPYKEEEDVKIIHTAMPEKVESSLVDSLIAKQMSSLTMDQREQAYFDIHGISNNDETPELIQQSMLEMEAELGILEDAAAYRKALDLNSQYVRQDRFRLKFLRADRFDPKKAALRMARHFEAKLDLFGQEKLCQDITQNDLNPGDMDALVTGVGHLPIRDSVGRLVRISFSHNGVDIAGSTMEILRALFYSLMVLADDEETQKNGVVFVSWAVGYKQDSNMVHVTKSDGFKNAIWAMVKLAFTAIPFRHEAFHLCYDNFFLSPIFGMIKLSLGMYMGVRVRTHYGNKLECQRKLQTFGIPTTVMPLKAADMDHAKEIWKKRLAYEKWSSNPSHEGNPRPRSVFVPGHLDILLGRGRRCQEHVGNMRLRNLVEDCKPEYDQASRKEKTLISQEIVDNVKKNSHHFLKDEDEGWVEVDDQVARLKVSHTFRDVAKDATKKKEGNTSDNASVCSETKKRDRDS
ncbi:unnamed protein product [Cylindrotheca closterium]|uniref:DUF6824 domain-containing protein n=1 Tax=Cylindrotheca closterium TaxID=2856 RepID=A0AAD2FQZ9_9STRA|nr:unnamed protein product [Cylindrotheca closterium]